MEYSYLNQSFDPTTCPLGGGPMDPSAACQLTCTGYGDPLGSAGCTPTGYGRYGHGNHMSAHGGSSASAAAAAAMSSAMRSAGSGVVHNPHGPIGHPATNGASMIAAAAAGRMNAAAAARAHAESMQNSMFQTGLGLQSKSL